MTTMIEKMARAIWDVQHPTGTSWDDWARFAEQNPDRFDGRDGSRDLARAALTALLEPSEAMAAAGADNLFGSSSDDWSDDARAVWSAMVQAALDEKDG
jgi:hypothetical protein